MRAKKKPAWEEVEWLGEAVFEDCARGDALDPGQAGAQQTVHFGYSVDYFTFLSKSYRGDRDLNDTPVYFDLARGGEYYYLSIGPDLDGGKSLVHFRGEHYYYYFDHWIDICFYLTGEDNKGRSLIELGRVTPFGGHAWISPSDSSGYYVPVYFRRSSSSDWEMLGNY